MLHIHRLVSGLVNFRAQVITQKLKGRWTGPDPVLVPRSRWQRELGRLCSRLSQRPWQVPSKEAVQIVRAARETDVLHIFFGSSAIHLLPVVRAANLPVVVSFHGSDVTGTIASKGAKPLREELFQLATLVGCRSTDLEDKVAALGCPSTKIRPLPTGIPLPKLRPPRAVSTGQPVIVQAGRLVPKKGHDITLKAFARIRAVHPDARLVIAGSGPLESELRERSASLGGVEFVGFLDQNQLQEIIAKADLLVHPSLTVDGDREGIPNVILEAMALGTPCVATRHGGIQQAIPNPQCGALVSEKDPDELAHAILDLLASGERCRQISEDARVHVEKNFSLPASVAAAEMLYHEAIDLTVK